MTEPLRSVTAVILAGGRGRRMGGADKGLLEWRGRPLVAHLVEAVAPQVEQLLINANRNRADYERFGLPVVADSLEGFQGPLAGILAAMEITETPFLLTLPCDVPRVPDDLVQRLYEALESSDAEVAVAHDGSRLQPAHALLRTSLKPVLERDLAAGERRLTGWLQGRKMVTVDFSDHPGAFINLNRPEDRAALESVRDGQ